jgi:phosphatidylserine/phosphatidylglycerophosphate/cardiolipin synthase-like enzyme
MISLSSTTELLAEMQRAHDITLTAYALPKGAVLDALAGAAQRGAHVRVRLEGYIYKDDGTVGDANAAAVTELRHAGADVRLVHRSVDAPDPMLHLKGVVVDRALFLDDRNWPDDGGDTIVRDTFSGDAQMVCDAAAGSEDRSTPFFAVRKRDALASEARLIGEAQAGDEVIVESESFGAGNRVYAALDAAAKRGADVRLLVAGRELENNPNERDAIRQLVRDGVQARVCSDDEKFAVVRNARGWIGSTNATAAFNEPDQLDWGLRTDDEQLLTHLRSAFESRWNATLPRIKGA